MPRKSDIKKLIKNHERRLQKLKEIQALRGLDTPADILLEIEDITAAIQELYMELRIFEESKVDEETKKNLSEPATGASTERRVEIVLEGDFASFSDEDLGVTLDAFAQVIGISREEIEIDGLRNGNLIIPATTAPRIRSLLNSNNEQLHSLNIERVMLKKDTGEIEEWIRKEGQYHRNLSRFEWLQAHGFVSDPFPGNSFRAERDPLFDQAGMPAFVDPPNPDEILGSPNNPGCCFIFAVSGGGKSSLRRRIKSIFDDSLGMNLLGNPRVLAVEYIDHDYALEEADARFHIIRIAQLIRDKLRSLQYDVPIDIPGALSPRLILVEIVNICRRANLDGICVLVDNIDSRHDQDLELAFNRIVSLAANVDLLDVKGILFKFMLPMELLKLARRKLPLDEYVYHLIKWDKDNLAEVLHQRLVACIDPSLRDTTIAPLAELCDIKVSDRIEDSFVQLGVELNQPRAMWRLGFHLLQEHFNQSQSHRRLSTELIDQAALLSAYERVTEVMGEEDDKLPTLTRIDEKLIRQIEEHISQDQLREAINLFQLINENVAIMLQSRLTRLEQDISFGTITREEAYVQEDRIKESLLQQLQNVQKK